LKNCLDNQQSRFAFSFANIAKEGEFYGTKPGKERKETKGDFVQPFSGKYG
jgi:hypothetical protein